MKKVTPSENEWLIMELFWKNNCSMTSAEVIEALQKKRISARRQLGS